MSRVNVFHYDRMTDEYRHVAYLDVTEEGTFEVQRLEAAWEATNTISAPWYKTGRAIPVGDAANGCRSSMTGDVFELDGRYFEVAMIGFEEVSPIGMPVPTA